MDKHHVDVFKLENAEDKDNYELLLNMANVEVYKEQFAYTSKGEARITVWYLMEDED